MAEQSAVNRKVVGSSPTSGAKSNSMKQRQSEPKATIGDPFTFGNSKAAKDLVEELLKIEPARKRKFQIKTVQTALSRCGLGVNEIATMEHPHIKFELLILWRKFWINAVEKANLEPKVLTRVRSIIVAKTREEMKVAMEEIQFDKEYRRMKIDG